MVSAHGTCKNSEDDSNVGKIRPGLASIGSESKAAPRCSSLTDQTKIQIKMSPADFSSSSLASSFKALYDDREESGDTDFKIVTQDDSEIPVHSFLLGLR